MKKIISILLTIIIILSSISALHCVANATFPLAFLDYEHLPITKNKPFGLYSIRQGTLSSVDRGNGDLALKIDGNYEFDIIQNPEDKGGVWEFSFDFRTNDAKKTRLGFRMTANVTTGSGIKIGTYDSIYYVASPVEGQSPGGKVNGKIGNLSYKVGNTEADWNTYKFVIDYVNDTYAEYLNGSLACTGTIGKSAESFQRIRLLGQFSGSDGGYFDNFTIKRQGPEINISSIKYKMKYAGETEGENYTINGTNLETITFTLDTPATVNSENAKIINANGDVVSTSVTTNGSDIVFGGFTSSTLPNGYYNLVLEESAIVGGVSIGAEYKKYFTVNNLFYSKNIIKPKENATHPFVFLNDEFISSIYDESGNVKDIFKTSFKEQKRLATASLPKLASSQSAMNSSTSQRLMARALMYALGELDYSGARETILYTLKYLENPYTASTYSIDMYKDLGTNGLQLGALVYDWCYDAFENDEERKLFAKRTLAIYEIKQDTNGDGTIEYVQPCRPDNISSWGALAGKAVGQPIIYNSICAIAFSDIYEDIRDELPENYPDNLYNVMMGKIQGDMATVVRTYGTAGALSDGSIAYSRDYYTYYVYVMLKRLGATDEELFTLYGNQEPIGYKMLYSRLPYGGLIKQGDDYSYIKTNLLSYVNRAETTDMGLLANMYGNEYFNFQYLKENYNATSILSFLTMFGDTGQKFPDDLPLAYETYAPRSEIMARTSWQDGITSKTVTAYMNMNERRSGDHDHSDIGNFQLYYKGPLTMPNSIYDGNDWGTSHFFSYATRSVSANCVTVYMPNEQFRPKYKDANDGGQKIPLNQSGGTVIGSLAEHFADSNIWAVNEGTFIGPNPKTPAFSYIKGDITNAYHHDKMDSYKRSMVFMDTFSDTYPGVMIVFDRVVSKDASYTKKWLLQSVVNPEVNTADNKITIKNQLYGSNGKLVNKTLLPEDVNIEKVGGLNQYISEGKTYTAPNIERIDIYRSGYRLEVSPKSENTEDIFLNAMFVADADTTAPDLEMVKLEDGEMVGVATLNRQVMFRKDGKSFNEEFTVNVADNNSGSEMLVLLTDVAEGKWKVYGTNYNEVFESKKSDNAFAFEARPGEYTITPVNNETAVSNISWPEEEKEKFGDFVIKLDSSYMYMPDETLIKDDVLYVSGDTATHTGKKTSATQNGSQLIINRNGNKSIINAGENFYTYNGSKINITAPAIMHNGKVYVPIAEMGTALAITCEYSPEIKVLKISSGSDIPAENLITPINVSAHEVNNTAILYDGIVGDALSFPNADEKLYLNTPIVYTLSDELQKIEKIEIYGSGIVSGGESTVKFLASADGKSYYRFEHNTVISGSTYTFTPKNDTYAKYIKFIPEASSKLREIAVFGKTADTKCYFLDKKESIVSSNIPFETQIYLENGFTSASLYIENEKIHDFSAVDGTVHNISIPADVISKYSGTKSLITINCEHSSETYSDTREVTFVNGSENLQIVNMDFDNNSFRNISSNGSVTPSTNLQGYAIGKFTGGKYIMTLPEGACTNTPFILFNKLKKYIPSLGQYASLNQGTFKVKFDLELSSENVSFDLESRTRDVNNPDLSNNTSVTYPKSGPTNRLIFKEKGVLEVTIVLDTINCNGKLYTAKINPETGEKAEKVLAKEFYYNSNSLGQLRFLISKVNTAEEFITFDNFSVDYREINTQNIVFSKDGNNKLFANISTDAFEGEDIKIIKAVKLNGKLVSLNIENISDTTEFVIPEDFYKTNGYTAELYVYSKDNLLNPLDIASYISK